jgi:hypothetical protein
MYVDLGVVINGDLAFKISNGGSHNIELGEGRYVIFIDALYRIYRSQKIVLEITGDDKEIHLQLGPSVSNAYNPLAVIMQSILPWRSFYIRRTACPDESPPIVHETNVVRTLADRDIVLAVVLLAPIIQFLFVEISYPAIYQVIGNGIVLFGLLLKWVVKHYANGVSLPPTLPPGYFFVMLFVTYSDLYLLIYNVLCLFLIAFLFYGMKNNGLERIWRS